MEKKLVHMWVICGPWFVAYCLVSLFGGTIWADETPCEVELRAVDIDTGKGITGISFYRFNTGAEDWHHAIEGRTDGEGYVRAKLKRYPLISNYFYYGIWKKPSGWGVVSLDDVNFETPPGGRASHTFYLRQQKFPVIRKPTALTEEERQKVPEPKPQPKHACWLSTVNGMPGFDGKEVRFHFYPNAQKEVTQEQRDLAAEIYRSGKEVAAAVRDELTYFQKTAPEDKGKFEEKNRILITVHRLNTTTGKVHWQLEFHLPGGIQQSNGYVVNFKDLDSWDLYFPDYRRDRPPYRVPATGEKRKN